MLNKPIIIVCGEPNSIFSEILIKTLKIYKNKKPIVLIGSVKLLYSQFEKLKLKQNLNLVVFKDKKFIGIKKNELNIINVNYNFQKPFEKISKKSNKYIFNCFENALEILKNSNSSGLINGPISKKNFLGKKHQGITEFLKKKFKNNDKYAMLIYNKKLSVCPITTHIPIRKIYSKISKNKIVVKCLLISDFFKKKFKRKPKIAITGLNPHCENFVSVSEEKKIIEPSIKKLINKGVKISGPYPADTVFLKQNIKRFDIVIGMYHDQVLAPAKALFNFNAINITLGLPFLRISPDHGPNYKMIGKNKSNPESLLKAIKFLDNNK